MHRGLILHLRGIPEICITINEEIKNVDQKLKGNRSSKFDGHSQFESNSKKT
jgi:hypothetical protein